MHPTKYRSKRIIGKGSSGIVSVAENEMGNQIALKIIDKKKQNEILIQNETSLHQSLHHPNIVRLYKSFSTHEYSFLIMEYMEGGDLFSAVLPEHGIGEYLTVHYMKQIVSALEYLHSRDIVHRDIKPENVALDKEKITCKLLDFGFACHSHHPLTPTAGTTPYLSPECIACPGAVKDLKAVDIWALGILLFALLAGSFPWGKASNECVQYVRFQNKDFSFAPWNQFTENLLQLFQGMLCVSPADRFQISDVRKYLNYGFFRASKSPSSASYPECSSPIRKDCYLYRCPSWKQLMMGLAPYESHEMDTGEEGGFDGEVSRRFHQSQLEPSSKSLQQIGSNKTPAAHLLNELSEIDSQFQTLSTTSFLVEIFFPAH